jgi:acyl-coenzyme A thioesterase PaaI-like protein
MTASTIATAAPPVNPPPDWRPCEPFPKHVETDNTFVSGGPRGARLRVAYFRRAADERLVGRAWFGPETEGPPGHAHGGSVASVLDEALGAAAWADGHPVVVARLEVDFRLMVPLGTDATFVAWVEAIEGRKIITRAELTNEAGELLARGNALCVTLGSDHLELFQTTLSQRRPARDDAS